MTPQDARARGYRWAIWLHQQNEDARPQSGDVTCSLLGALLGEAMEGYRRTGKAALAKNVAHACLIHADTPRPDSQDDDAPEWEFQHALDRMPPVMREIKKCVIAGLLWNLSPLSTAIRLKMKEGTYKSLEAQGFVWLARELTR